MGGVEIALDTAPRSVPLARRWLAEVLGPASRYDTDVARLLLSEVVTSAMLQARSGLVVRVEDSGVRLRVEVASARSTRDARSSPAAPGSDLHVVDLLAAASGTCGDGDDRPGTTTWFELLPVDARRASQVSSGVGA
ncbi:MAG: hypothetical protein ACLGIG_00970 [Actinomycetes bacterium]